MHQRWLAFALAAVLAFCAASARAQVPMRVEASAQQPDGKVLMAGQVPGSQFPMQIRVGRVNADGSLDTTFAGGWTTYGSATATSEFRVTAIGVDASGRVIVAAVQDGSVALVRFDGSGNVDQSFGGFTPGMVVDFQSQGIHVNAILVGPAGDVTGLGSYAGPETSNVTQASLFHFDTAGYRVMSGWPAGVQLVPIFQSPSELNAVAPWFGSGFIGVGTAGSIGNRVFLVAAFTSSGDLDRSFYGGGQRLFADGVAQSVWTLPGSTIVVAGHNDDRTFGHDSNASIVAVLDGSGNSDPAFTWLDSLTTFVTVQPGGFHDGSATTVAGFEPGSGKFVFAGSVVEAATGRSFLYNYLETAGYSSAAAPMPNPRTDADDAMSAAFPAGDFFLAVGTRDSVAGERALRVRYFADTGEFDTDFPVEGEDSTPNPFGFGQVVVNIPAWAGQSLPARITGINVPTPISVANGEYSIDDCQNFTAAPGTIVDGQHVCLRGVGASTADTSVMVTLTVGDVSGSFEIRTTSLPDTYLDGTPPNPASSAAAATFYFHGQDSGWYAATGYECSLDGAAFASCSSGAAYSALAPGNHTFAVRGLNAWGADASPASYSWTVLDPADTTITSGPPPATNQPTATFTFNSNDPLATFQCHLNGAAFTACTSPATVTAGFGSNTFYVRAVNALGADASPASATWTLDTTAPSTTLTTNILEGERYVVNTATFSLGANEPATFLCGIDGSAFSACATPVTLSGLADGAHIFTVRAVDAAGNVDAIGKTRHWTVSFNPPIATMPSPPSNPSGVASPSMYFSVPGVALNQQTYDCWVDGAQVAGCYFGYTIDNLRDGTHVFQFRANPAGRDASNNVVWQQGAIQSYTWVVDLAPPQTTLTGWPAAYARNPANFFYSSDNYGAGFDCSLDGGTWVDCSSQSQAHYDALADGQHTFAVRAKTATKVDPTPATYTWTVDSTPPIVSITAHPPAASGTTAATFSFSANESNTTFMCLLGTGTFTPCSSPVTYTGLAAGSQTFNVLATDAAGNASGASWTWTIDLTAPDTTLDSAPSGTVAQSSATLVFSSSESSVSYECSLDGAAFSTCASPMTLFGLADGAHGFQVRARDSAGNVDASPASASWIVDTTAPDTTLTGGPSGTVAQRTAVFTFTSNDPGAVFECSLDSGTWSSCTNGGAYSGLAEGMHMFDVRARDAVGNVDPTPASRTWSIDLTNPNTTITGGPSAVTSQTGATFTFAASESATFHCALDGAAYSTCSSPLGFSSLADGSHSFAVYASDTAGNADPSPATWSWAVDSTPPETTLTATPPASSNSTGASFSFIANEAASFRCVLDSGAFAACSSPKAYTGLAAGSHVFQVYAVDSVGNADPTPAAWTWSIDLAPPDTTITGGPSGNNNPSTASFTFTATESGSTFQCKVDSGTFAACTSPKAYSGLAKGSHTFQVKATDAAGNADATPATRTWSVK